MLRQTHLWVLSHEKTCRFLLSFEWKKNAEIVIKNGRKASVFIYLEKCRSFVLLVDFSENFFYSANKKNALVNKNIKR